MKNKFKLILILVLALFLRLYLLNLNPPSLNWDEISHGYNAYSILKTGKDEWGFRFPLIFRAYGDYKLPLYIYLTVPGVAVLGLNAYSVRLVSVFSGIGLVLISYLIGQKITKNEFSGLLAAFLTAISPWSLFVSRVAVEANLGAFLFSLGMFFLISWLERNRPKNLFLTAFFWGLSLHAYNSARILVPLFSILIVFLIFKKKKLNQLAFFMVTLAIFLLPVVSQLFDKTAKARFGWVSLIDEGAIYQIGEKRANSSLPKPIPLIIFNKATFWSYYAVKNYFANFSLKYLFFRGGSHYQFSFSDHELLYLVTAPFLIFGLIKSLASKGEERVLSFWFLVAFIPSAITRDAPHVLRSILILPTPMVLTALGLKEFNDFLKGESALKGNLLNIAFVFIVLISFCRWWNDYFSIYPKAYSWAWQYGYKQAISYIKENYSKYETIFFTKKYGEPHEFVAFWFPWEPKNFQKQRKWDYHVNWYWTNALEKFIFVNDWEISNSSKFKVQSSKCDGRSAKCLLVTSPGNYPEGWNEVKIINFLDEKPAFEILER